MKKELYGPCDYAKCFLSTRSATPIKVRLDDGVNLDTELTREDLEKIAEPVFQ